MKNRFIITLFGIWLFFASCTTAYKSSQTPDDVYYSPAKPAVEQIVMVQNTNLRDAYDNYANNMDEQFLRMKVGNYYRWSMLDDYSYWNDSRYDFSYYNYYSSLGFNTYSNFSKSYWNIGLGNYYNYPIYTLGNPYYTLVTYYHPTINFGTASLSGISAYSNKTYSNNNSNIYSNTKTGFNNTTTPQASNFGNLVRRVFNSNGSTDSYDRPARTFDNSNNSYRQNNNSSSYTNTSSNAGGNSGGVKSTGSSASSGRTTRN